MCGVTHFNPRSPHGERHLLTEYNAATGLISIHAPRTGSDHLRVAGYKRIVISIHAPRTGSDLLALAVELRHTEFQSTLPARGATVEEGVRQIRAM